MASLFSARRQAAESGSGGKILYDRLRDQPPRPSPYARSPPLALPPPPPGSPRWFLGLVSGAGKLISSVFRADSSSPDSSDYSSDHDRSSSRSDEQNIDAPKQLHGSSRELTKSEEIADCMEVSHTIVPVSETKLAIEKLLQQETFSRDECERLTKLLQSRVADSPSVFVQDKVGEAISNGLPGNAVEFSGAWLSLQQCNVLPGSDVRDDASPVYLAKSYMQSLSPQQSPSDGSITLSSMIASKEDLLTDSSNHARTSNSLSSIKDFKRNYFSSGLQESPDNNKRPHLILADTLLENPSSKLIDSQELFQTETSKISPAADERDPYFLRTVQFSSSQSSLEASNAPAKSLVEHVEDLCHNDYGNLVDKPINEDLAVKSTSATLTSEPMETLKALVEKIASPTISSLGPTPSDTPTEHKLPSYLDANKDVVKASPTVIIIDDDVPHESFISASASKVPDDAKSQDQNLCSLHAADGSGHEFSKNGGSPESNVNPQLVSQENKSFTQFSNGEQTTDVAKVIEEHPSRENHITTKSQKVTKRKSIEQISVSPRPRTRQAAKREDAKDAADGSGHEFSKNGGSPESNVNPQLVSQENKSFTQFSNGEQTTDVAKVIEEHPSRENHITTKSQKVTKRKSIEQISVSPRPRTRQAAKREDAKDASDGSGHEFSKNGGSPESNVNPQFVSQENKSFTQFSNGEQTTDVAKVIEEHPSRENHITTKSQKVTKRKSIEQISVSPRPRTRQTAKREDAKDAADGSGHEFSKNGGSPESNVNPQLVSQENKSFTQFSNGEQTTDVAKVIEEHPSRENHITTKSQKVTKRKSIEQISVSPRPRTRQTAKREDAKDAADGSGHEFSKNGGSPESNVNPQLVSQENKSFIQFSNGEQTTDVAKVIEEHPSRENHITTKSQKVTKRKSIEQISVSPRPRTRQAAKREDAKDAADGSGHEFSKNGGSPESNVNPQLVSQENKSFIQFSNGEQTTDVAKVIEEHPSMDPAHRENHITTKSQKVTKRKSLEHISVSPRPRTRQQAQREGKTGHHRG